VTAPPTVVFDTGVILQAALSGRGPARQVLNLALQHRITAYMSNQLRSEYEDVLLRPEIRVKNPALTAEVVGLFLRRLDLLFLRIPNPPHSINFPRDRKDEFVLDLAIAIPVDYLVSRDRDLLELSGNTVLGSLAPMLKIVDPVSLLQALSPSEEQ
jgi:putative PIN family toxin of toxin-antitoxin system